MEGNASLLRRLGPLAPAVLGLVLITHSSTASAADCYANECNGRDPKEMHCDADAITAGLPVSTGNVTIELRWSKACGANWARISPAPKDWKFRVENKQGHHWDETVDYESPSWFGKMVNGLGVDSRACFMNNVCTNWN